MLAQGNPAKLFRKQFIARRASFQPPGVSDK